MHMKSPDPELRQRFLAAVGREEEEINLAETALMVAQEEYPQLPLGRYLGRLDLLAEEVRDRLDEENADLVVLQELLRVRYNRQNFRGNREAYYDPRNSFLNDVLDRKLGIPLTLGIVLLEVGWRLDLPLEGVNFPGHFLVRFRGDAIDLLVDPYDSGAVRFEDEAQQLLDRVYGPVSPWVPVNSALLIGLGIILSQRTSAAAFLIYILMPIQGALTHFIPGGQAPAAAWAEVFSSPWMAAALLVAEAGLLAFVLTSHPPRK